MTSFELRHLLCILSQLNAIPGNTPQQLRHLNPVKFLFIDKGVIGYSRYMIYL